MGRIDSVLFPFEARKRRASSIAASMPSITPSQPTMSGG
jgi:hypothetical protein